MTNGNCTVASPYWNNGAGGVTWSAEGGGPVGADSSSNSLIGSKASELVGNGEVTALLNGNYVVVSSSAGNLEAVSIPFPFPAVHFRARPVLLPPVP